MAFNPVFDPVFNPVFDPVTNPFAGLRPIFNLPLQTSVVPIRAAGSPTATFTRATTATVLDFEGLIKPVLSGEVRFKGARRVENLITGSSEDMTSGGYGSSPSVSVTATQATFDGTALAQVVNSISVVDDGAGAATRKYVFSVSIRLISGTISSDAALKIEIKGDSISNVVINIGDEVTSTAQRFAITAANDAAGTTITPLVVFEDAGVLEITEWQLEEITGNTIVTPSEYVSTGVLSSPFHGCMVDSCKYFLTANANTVSGTGIVTEATGDLLGTADSTELVANGEAWTGASGATPPTSWTTSGSTQTYATSNGQLTIDRNGEATGSDANMDQGLTGATTGGRYLLSVDIISNDAVGGNIIVTVDGTETAFPYNNGQQINHYFTAADTTPAISIRPGHNANQIIVIDNFTVRESGFYNDADGPFGYRAEAQHINIALQGRTWQNVAWTATNITPNDDEVAGPDGRVRAASLTATAGNGTIIQDLGVIGSAAKVWGPWIKRKTGTGDIDLTLDGGGSWTTITVTAAWTRVQITATLANPDIGIRIVTSGDAVYVDYAQAEANTFLGSTTPETVGSAITVNADVLTFASAGNILDVAGTAFASVSSDWATETTAPFALARDVNGRILYNATTNSTDIGVLDGTNTSISPTGTSFQGIPTKLASTWGTALTAYFAGTPDATPASYDGTMGTGDIAIGSRNTGANSWGGTIRFVQIFSKELNATQVGALPQ